MGTIDRIKIEVDPELAEFMPQYIQNRKSDLDRLKAFLHNHDFESIRVISHKIRGHAMSYGLAPLGDICKKLEAAVSQDSEQEVQQLIADYEAYLVRIELPKT